MAQNHNPGFPNHGVPPTGTPLDVTLEIPPRASRVETPPPALPTPEEDFANRMQVVKSGLRVMDLGFYIVYCLIGMQVVLEALGARDWAGFKRFLDVLSAPFIQPFKGLVADPRIDNYQLMGSYLIAIAVYMIAQSLVHKIVRVIAEATRPKPFHS